jgi:hypothetical protein
MGKRPPKTSDAQGAVTMSDRTVLRIDPIREGLPKEEQLFTSLYVRALGSDGRWHTVDIWMLDKESLLRWLRSRGGDNPYAEDVVGILLDHGHLHPFEDSSETENSNG